MIWARFDILVLIVGIILSIYAHQYILAIPTIGLLIYILSGGNPYKRLL